MIRPARLSVLLLAVALLAAPAFGASNRRSASYFLNQNLTDLKFTNVSLSEAIDYLRDVSGANIYVDWKTLEAANVEKETLINVHLRNVSLRKALATVLSEAGAGNLLTFYWDENVLTVTTQEKADSIMYTVVYPVKDLLVSLPNISVDTANQNFLSNSNSNSTINLGAGASGGSGNSNSLSFNNSNNNNNTSGNTLESFAQKGQDLVTLVESTVRPEVWKENGGTASIVFWQGNLVVHAPISVLEAIGGPLD